METSTMQKLTDRISQEDSSANSLSEDVLVIILQVRSEKFKGHIRPYEMSICGKKMWEWLSLVAEGFLIKTKPYDIDAELLSTIKPLLINTKYTAVLYSDTPLLQRGTFLEIIDYMTCRDTNVLKLPRGYVFNTEFLKQAESIAISQPTAFGTNDFFVVSDYKTLAEAERVLQDTICRFHLENGVRIQRPATVCIDADCIIDTPCEIRANTQILGNSYISKGCVIGENATIIDSIISANCVVENSRIVNSRIAENKVVGPFVSLNNSNE